MMLQVGDDGVVSSVNEEELIYVDKNELEQFVESYRQLEKENEQLKKDCNILICSNQEYRKENEQLKSEIKDLNDVLARYEEKELKE